MLLNFCPSARWELFLLFFICCRSAPVLMFGSQQHHSPSINNKVELFSCFKLPFDSWIIVARVGGGLQAGADCRLYCCCSHPRGISHWHWGSVRHNLMDHCWMYVWRRNIDKGLDGCHEWAYANSWMVCGVKCWLSHVGPWSKSNCAMLFEFYASNNHPHQTIPFHKVE